MRIDCHTHPLSHRYYYDGCYPQELTEQDQADIKGLLNMAVERGLDAVAVTDHDMALSGLWAKTYAGQANLPIQVIAGCECELYLQDAWIHILALNIKQALCYTPYTKPAELVRQIHAQRGIAVLAHPMCYHVDVYHELKRIVDGVEYRNGAQESGGRPSFAAVLDQDGYRGLRLYNSDYHYPGMIAPEQWNAATEMTETEFAAWFLR